MSGKPTACELVSLYLPEWLITISNLSLVTDLEIGVCSFQCLVGAGLADCLMTVLFSMPGGYWVGWLCDDCVVFSAWWILGWLTVWWLCCFQCLVGAGLADCVMTVLFLMPGGYWVGWLCDDCVVFSAWWILGWQTVWWLCCFQCLVGAGLADCVMAVLFSMPGGCRVGWLFDGCVVFNAWWILGRLTVWWLCCFQCLVGAGLADCVMTVLFSMPGGYWVGWLCDDCVVFNAWWILGWLTVWWLCCFQCLVDTGLADCVMAVLFSVPGGCQVGWLCDGCVVFSAWWILGWLTVWWLCCVQWLVGAGLADCVMAVLFSVPGGCRVGWLCDGCVVFSDWWVPGWLTVLCSVTGGCRVGWLCDGCVVFSAWWVPGWLTVWWLCCVQWLVGAGLDDCVVFSDWWVPGWLTVWWLCCFQWLVNARLAHYVWRVWFSMLADHIWWLCCFQCLVGAGLADYGRPAEKLSLSQSVALTATGKSRHLPDLGYVLISLVQNQIW